MPAVVFMGGQWEGEFVYGHGYGRIEGEKASFSLSLSETRNGFTGECIDVGGFGVIAGKNDKATVSGFFQDGLISFIKTYPEMGFFNADGSVYPEARVPGEIHYSGFYDAGTDSFSGEWEIELREKTEFGIEEYVCKGFWSMTKVAGR